MRSSPLLLSSLLSFSILGNEHHVITMAMTSTSAVVAAVAAGQCVVHEVISILCPPLSSLSLTALLVHHKL